MNAIDILNNLKVFQDLLTELHLHEVSSLQQKKDFVKLTKSLENAYSFIRLELTTVFKVEEQSDETNERLCAKVEFELKGERVLLKEIYCEDNSRVSSLKELLARSGIVSNFSWKVRPAAHPYYSERISNYLKIADSIANRAVNCATGDDYSPGNFSRLFIDDENIVLSQVNYMNSRSRDHRDDYSLRKLEFTIPLRTIEQPVARGDYQLGEMLIDYSDGSSKNNKACGNAIVEQITVELEKEKLRNK
jgi:hypothetical protein